MGCKALVEDGNLVDVESLEGTSPESRSVDILVIPVLIHEVSVASNTSREAVETPPVRQENSTRRTNLYLLW